MVFVLRTEIRFSSSGNKVIICIREHRSEVRTIEQILSKYILVVVIFNSLATVIQIPAHLIWVQWSTLWVILGPYHPSC